MTPYSWTCDELPENFSDMSTAAKRAVAEILKVFNNTHKGDDAYWRAGNFSYFW